MIKAIDAQRMISEINNNKHQQAYCDLRGGFDALILDACANGRDYMYASWGDFHRFNALIPRVNERVDDKFFYNVAANEFIDALIQDGYAVNFYYDIDDQPIGLVICWGVNKELDCIHLSEGCFDEME